MITWHVVKDGVLQGDWKGMEYGQALEMLEWLRCFRSHEGSWSICMKVGRSERAESKMKESDWRIGR